jgi:peptidoglycan/LPS O-acetylase OafA/YrhL
MKRTDIASLTGLRFIAALSVAWSHDFLHLVPNQDFPVWYLLLSGLAGFGMPLFFVLSGFVIQYNYGDWFAGGLRKGQVARFLAYRFTRLYPLYITLLVLEYFINPYGEFPHLFHALPYYLTMTQTWVYQTIDKNSLVYAFPSSWTAAVAWSISTEWAFYCVFPFLARPLARLRSPRAVFSIALGIGIFQISWPLLTRTFVLTHDSELGMLFGASPVAGVQDSFARWLYYFSPYGQAANFVVGALLAKAYQLRSDADFTRRELKMGRSALVAACTLFAALYVVAFSNLSAQVTFLATYVNALFLLPIAAIIFLSAQYPQACRLLGRPVMIWGGEASYSIYLLHMLVLRLFVSYGPGANGVVWLEWTRLAAALTLTLLLARGLYLALEMPAQRALRSAFDRWKAAARRKLLPPEPVPSPHFRPGR